MPGPAGEAHPCAGGYTSADSVVLALLLAAGLVGVSVPTGIGAEDDLVALIPQADRKFNRTGGHGRLKRIGSSTARAATGG
jgi:hypothetical protein